MINILSTNGTNTQTFTPTQPYVWVKFLSGNAYSLADMSLVSVDVDTSYSLIARGSYRYGFQGQERDDEIKGAGNSYNYEYRMHDPRLGRFFAIDPLASKYPYYSSYQFSGNRVIDCIELEGLEPEITGKENVGHTELAAEKGTNKIYYWILKQCEGESNCTIYEKGDAYNHPSVKDNAEMANSVYNIFNEEANINIGDKVPNTEYTLYKKYGSDNGYKAALYRREIDGVEFFNLAFAGTDDFHDVITDAAAGMSNEFALDLGVAMLEARRINNWCSGRGANFSVTGHSLGGGLATMASGETGKYACTFNAMGVSAALQSKWGVKVINSKIDAYVISGEALNAAQFVKANGMQHKLDSKTHSYGRDPNNLLFYLGNDAIYLHSMTRFIEIYRK